jgi:hypothetical protein
MNHPKRPIPGWLVCIAHCLLEEHFHIDSGENLGFVQSEQSCTETLGCDVPWSML